LLLSLSQSQFHATRPVQEKHPHFGDIENEIQLSHDFMDLIAEMYLSLKAAMKNTSIQISIPKPCHEDWQKMETSERGAFCRSCRKEVVDFTRMTDEQVISYLSTATGVCGRLREDQVSRRLRLYRPAEGFLRWRMFALGLLPLLAMSCNMPKGEVQASQTENTRQENRTLGAVVSVETKPVQPADTLYLTGRVLDADHKPIAYATVSIVDTTTRYAYETTRTDKTGQYALTVKVSAHDRRHHMLEARYHAYRPEFVSFTSEERQQHDIILSKPNREMMGEVKISE